MRDLNTNENKQTEHLCSHTPNPLDIIDHAVYKIEALSCMLTEHSEENSILTGHHAGIYFLFQDIAAELKYASNSLGKQIQTLRRGV